MELKLSEPWTAPRGVLVPSKDYEILNLYFIFIGCSSASLPTFTAAHIKAYYL